MIEGRKKKFIKELLTKKKAREESGLFIVDGPKMCSEIPEELLEEVFVTENFLTSSFLSFCEKILKVKGYTVVTEAEMKQISDTVTPQGILCLVKKEKVHGIRELIEAGGKETPLLMILETLQDPGNLGTIFRAAEAAGVTGILMNDTTVDVYSPKATRSTMGAIFRMPFLYVKDLQKAVMSLREGAYTEGIPVGVLAADLKSSKDYTLIDYRKPKAILIGNESKGLTRELVELSTESIKIPMRGSVESLNAAMAATIICFEAARQRRT